MIEDGAPYVVVEAQFDEAGQELRLHAATKMKNLLTGGSSSATSRSGEKMDGANVEDRRVHVPATRGRRNLRVHGQSPVEQIAVPLRTSSTMHEVP